MTNEASDTHGFDADWIVIGSGFGGSVSALRLAEKGYSVTVLEAGRRFRDSDYARSTWDLRRYYWLPRLGLRGIFRLTLFRDVFVASGVGVGGGSLTYASTHYRPRSTDFFSDPQWAGLADWQAELEPHFATADRMLGVTVYDAQGPQDQLIRDIGEHLGVEASVKATPVAVFLGEPGVEVPDPYFGGEGPARTGCIRCGECMVGCRWGAKNTLVKNYLWFAERLGVRIGPERQVTDIRPLGDGSGADGWELTVEHPGAWLRKRRATLRTRNVIVAGGALGSNALLRACRDRGSLPRLSDRLGHLVRTNSEAIMGVTVPRRSGTDFSRSVAISSSVYTDEHTHIEPVTYGAGGGSISLLATLLTPSGSRLTRPLKLLAQIVRHPVRFARITWPVGWSRRSILLLVMQTHDNAIRFVPKPGWLRRRHGRLTTLQDPDRPLPSYLPIANWAAQWAAEHTGGVAQSSVPEALLGVPTTAHILGGCVIGAGPDTGVVDAQHRAFGYEGLYVIDGSTIPANIGANPSHTITALAERAMSFIPAAAPATRGGD